MLRDFSDVGRYFREYVEGLSNDPDALDLWSLLFGWNLHIVI